MSIQSISTRLLRPTQMTVGMRLVRWKRKGLRKLARKPQELLDFILENPVRVVIGPGEKAFVIDHHHLGLALLEERFKTAPVIVEDDLSALEEEPFWLEMTNRKWLRAVDAKGQLRSPEELPMRLKKLKDDPYRSLAGFVRYEGGFRKTSTPYMEFCWADYFRPLIQPSLLARDFGEAMHRALKLCHVPAAAGLPGYLPAAANEKKQVQADTDE